MNYGYLVVRNKIKGLFVSQECVKHSGFEASLLLGLIISDISH